MVYRRRRRKRLPKNFLKIAAAAVGILVLGFGLAWTVPRLGLTYPWEASRAKRVTKALSANPSLVSFYGPLQQYFPDDYRELSRGVASLEQRNASSGEIAQYSFLAMRAFVANHADSARPRRQPCQIANPKQLARILSPETRGRARNIGEPAEGRYPRQAVAAVRAISSPVSATIESAPSRPDHPITLDPQLRSRHHLLVRAIPKADDDNICAATRGASNGPAPSTNDRSRGLSEASPECRRRNPRN